MWWIPVQWNQNTTLLPQPYTISHSHCNSTTTGVKPSTTRTQLQWDPSGMNPSKINFAGTLHFWSLKLKHSHTHARTHAHTHTHTHARTHTCAHTHTWNYSVRAPDQCYLQEWKIEGLRAMPPQNMFWVTPTDRSKQKPKIKDFVFKSPFIQCSVSDLVLWIAICGAGCTQWQVFSEFACSACITSNTGHRSCMLMLPKKQDQRGSR